MKVNDLYLVNKNKVIPFYHLDLGKDFRMPMEVRGTHLCPYTKISARTAGCEQMGTIGTVPDMKLLVKPL